MKRLIAMLLAGVLTITLCLAADPDGVLLAPSMDDSPQVQAPVDGGAAAGTGGAAQPAADGQGAAADMPTAAPDAVAAVAASGNPAKTGTADGADSAQPTSRNIGFTGLDRTIRENNLTVKSNNETLAGISAMDTDAQEFAASSSQSFMQMLSGQISDSIAEIEQLDPSVVDPNLVSSIKQGLGAVQSFFDYNADVYKGQAKGIRTDTSIQDQYVLAKKQYDYVADQLVMGAQTLFITLHTMELQQQDAQRGLEQLTRAQTEMQKRYDLGQVSELELLKIKNQRSQTASTIESLKYQVKNLKGDLALMLGIDPAVNLTLSPLPASPNSKRNYDNDLKAAIKASYDLYFKNDTMRTASNDFKDDKTNTKHAYEAAKIAYQAAEQQLTQNFRKMYDAIPEKERAYNQAKADEDLQQRLYDAAAVKYQRGLISKNEYTTEKEALEAARSATQKAQIDLFTATNQYDWAVRGVVSGS